MRSLGESAKMMEAQGSSDAHSNAEVDGSGDIKIFRPTFFKRLGLFLVLSLFLGISAASVSNILDFFRGNPHHVSLAKLAFQLAFLTFFLMGIVMFCAWRQAIISIRFSNSEMVLRSIFGVKQVKNTEIIKIQFRQGLGIRTIAVVRVWYAGGSFILFNYEFTIKQMIEIFAFIEKLIRSSEPEGTNIDLIINSKPPFYRELINTKLLK
ncbi:MAG: hypothetical protein M3O03_05600 [Pseudomonadota bacterium]|nr:hypothetical protein [Pseudomonadota bacterium]